jgi:ATP-dependent Lon protease
MYSIDVNQYLSNHIKNKNFSKWIETKDLLSFKERIKDDFSNKYNNISPFKENLHISDFSIFDSLKSQFPNFSQVIDYYIGSFFFSQSKKSYSTPKPILLLGDPGLGKTFFSKKFAQLLNTSYHILDSNSIGGSWVLLGANKTFKDAGPGIFFDTMHKSKTVSPVFIFDEIDKISYEKTHNINSALHQILEKENSKQIYEEFCDCYLDLSNIIFILTANDISSIPQSLLSRMEVFNISKPDSDNMLIIIQNIYKELTKDSSLFSDTLSSDNVEKLINLSFRDIKSNIEKAIYKKSIDILTHKISDTISIDIEVSSQPKKIFGFNS